MPKILFIVKLRSGYNNYGHLKSGLYNSAKFVVDMLLANGFDAKLVSVVDNNDIDREVSQFKPDVVVVEALWIVPEKFDILTKLHPKVKWIVRGHSDIPFLAHEGIAIEWIRKYLHHRNVLVAFNSPRIIKDLKALFPRDKHKLLYLPNFYPLRSQSVQKAKDKALKIGCFGAIRPMKNHLLQAIAAIRFADKIGKNLEFHINGTRCEEGGDGVLKNLRSLFARTDHKLVEHGWLNHSDFVKLAGQMDYVLAVSFSETFCITAADAVAAGTPLICSAEVPWADSSSIVPTNSTDAIVDRLIHFRRGWRFISTLFNRRKLFNYSAASRDIWVETFGA